MEIGKYKLSYTVLLTTIVLIVVTRTYIRHFLPLNYSKHDLFNNFVYYYAFFATPIILVFLNKFFHEKSKFIIYFMSILNLFIVIIYVAKTILN